MALITNLNLPHQSGWTGVAGTYQDDGNGFSEPADPSVSTMAIYDTPLVETDSASSTTATIRKLTCGGSLVPGTVIRFYYDYIDANNHCWAELVVAGITFYADLKNDVVRLFKKVGGVVSPITGTSTLGRLQQEAGDLRHYLFDPRDTVLYPAITIITSHDQHLVKVTLKDSIDDHARDVVEFPILKETSTRHAAIWTTGGKLAIELVGGAHAGVVRKVQAMVTDSWWADPVSGNDANVGSRQAPRQNPAAWISLVQVNDVGFIRGGTVTQTVTNRTGLPGSNTVATIPTAQASYEDAPLYCTYGNETLTWHPFNSEGSLHLWGLSGNNPSFGTFYGKFVMDALNGDKRCMGLLAQVAGERAHAETVAIPRGHFYKGWAGLPVYWARDIFRYSTPAEYEQYHHFIDCDMSHSSNFDQGTQGTHGFYCESAKNVMEYCWLHDNEGNGAKFSYGTASGINGVKTPSDNIFRFNLSERNGAYGLLVYGGHRNRIDFNLVRNCSFKTSGLCGICAWVHSEETWIRQNVVSGCGRAGTTNSNIGIYAVFGSPAQGPFYVDGNTLIGGIPYNMALVRFNTEIMGPVHFTNNILRDPTIADEFFSPGLSYTTNANNWRTADGDPKLVNQAAGDYTLQEDSPLKNAGQDFSWSLPKDHRRLPIPQNLSRTIGAYDIPNPLPAALAIDLAATHQGVINSVIPVAPVVVDPGGRGTSAVITIQSGQLSITPSGTASVLLGDP